MDWVEDFDKSKCLNIPSKGGLPIEKVRQIAEYLGLPSTGTKAYLCDLIDNKLHTVATKTISNRFKALSPVSKAELTRIPKPLPKIPLSRIPKPLPAIPNAPASNLPMKTSNLPTKATSNLNKLYEELDSLITANSEKYECCINQYLAEIANIDKKLITGTQAKKVKIALDSIKKGLLDKFYKKYQDFYFEYLHLLTVYNRENALKVLTKWIPLLNDTYIHLLHDTLASIDLDTIHLLFPPNYVNFEYYQEDKNRVCAKNPKRDISTLLCFRSYMMQFMTRLMLLSKNIDKENGTQSNLTKLLENENAKLSELQKYIDGLFLCRRDYCDTKNCIKKSRFLRSATCEPSYAYKF